MEPVNKNKTFEERNHNMKNNKSMNMNNTDYIMAKGTMTIEMFTDMVKDALASHLRGCLSTMHLSLLEKGRTKLFKE